MTTSSARPWRLPVAVTTFLALAMPGCDDATDAPPEVVTRCGACHDVAALGAAAADDAGLAARDWAAAHGEGLVRVDPLFPEPGLWWATPWPRRGSHDPAALADCAGCHPMDADGIGHGIRTFRFPETVFAGGTDCAAACHAWLPDQASTTGFAPAGGVPPSWSGSPRPGALLAAADTAHSRLWREGARPSDPDRFGYGAFNPGCGGCHQVATEDHGHVPGCVDCHRFGGSRGPLHALHVAAIAGAADRIDPGLGASGGAFCDYCHADAATPGSRARATCYNCHLSGHQPVDASGIPHFWQPE